MKIVFQKKIVLFVHYYVFIWPILPDPFSKVS